MDYEVIMPVLSDTMEKGKLIKWHVKEGDEVKAGDVIAEVESDKAIMEVQTFKSGVVKKLLVKEGEEVPVKTPIAIIEVKEEEEEKPQKPSTATLPPVISELLEQKKTKEQAEEKKGIKPVSGIASPAARVLAAKEGIDIEKLQSLGQLPKPAHLKDVEREVLRRYFTPKALKLIEEYNIDISSFELNRKYSADDLLEYIEKNDIPLVKRLSSNRIAVKKMVEQSAKKPVYFMFESVDLGFEPKYKLTAYLIKILALAMQNHPLTRAVLEDDSLKIYPNSNISVAVSKGEELYMAVCKRAQKKSLKEIEEWLKEIKVRRLGPDDLKGSTFGLSNLGMFGVERFSAMIYDKDSGIAAFGKLGGGRIKVTFTFDHRILNGVDAALFVEDVKELFKNFKE